MKAILFTTIFLAICITIEAQILRPAVKKTNTVTAPPPPPPATTYTPVYTLTSVRVNIRTGNDNKEYPSIVWAFFGARSNTATASFKQENLKNEMKSNSNTEFGLEKNGNGNITLADLQKNGFQLTLWYFANFQFDAWKIEGIRITLEIRDQERNLHPTLGQKTITFGNANGFLNGYGDRRMICTADGFLNPLSAQISQ